MARGGASPVLSALPVVSFTKIDDEFSSKRISIPEQSIRAYGCTYNISDILYAHSRISLDNDGNSFQRPDHYTRYIGVYTTRFVVRTEHVEIHHRTSGE